MAELPRAFVIKYHSPLDVLSILPINCVVTEDPAVKADLFITQKLEVSSVADVTFVFTGQTFRDFTILDQNKPDESRTLTTKVMDQIFSKKREIS